MSLGRVRTGLTFARQCVVQHSHRNIGMTAPMVQKANVDPIQQLFVDKIREYAKKSSAAGGKLVDATPDVEQQLLKEITKIETQYNATEQNMTEFPTYTFTDPQLEPVGLKDEKTMDQEVVHT